MFQAKMWHPDTLNLKPETSHLKPYGDQGGRPSERGDGGEGSWEGSSADATGSTHPYSGKGRDVTGDSSPYQRAWLPHLQAARYDQEQ